MADVLLMKMSSELVEALATDHPTASDYVLCSAQGMAMNEADKEKSLP